MKTVSGPSERIVIVGAGLAGLSAAMHLAGAGREVTVLERATVPGGRAGLIEDAGYSFDPGPVVITMPELIESGFDALGESMADWLTLDPLDPLYRTYFPDGSQLDVHADADAMAAEIERVIGADEAAGYYQFVDFVTELYRLVMRGFLNGNFDSPLDALTPDMARLIAIGGFRRLAPKLHEYLKDPRTRRAFTFQALYAGVSPYDALAVYAVIAYMDTVRGVYAPRGGVHAMPAAMAAAAAAHGVQFRYGTDVVQVETKGNRAEAVITDAGERIPADTVVLNPDLPVAYRDLLGREPARHQYLRYSPSCYVMLAGSSAHYSKIAHHNIHFGRKWRGVFDDLIKHQQLMSDPSILVTNPTYTEPGLAPPGKQIYYVLFPTPNLDADIDWRTFEPRYREQVFATLEERGYRGFADAVETLHITTPQDWADQGMERGTPFAGAHTLLQTGPFRPGNLWGDNVVFTGSGTVPGVGVPPVLISGQLAAQRILGRTD